MAKPIFDARGHDGSLHATSFCGSARTSEPTRMRVQFEIVTNTSAITSLGFENVVKLRNALDGWIEENKPK